MRLPDHPFHVSEIGRFDLTRQDLRTLVADGTLRRTLTGVYVRADLPDTVELRARSAALALPDHVVVCDRTAAWLWGIDCFELHEVGTALPPIEAVSTGGHTRSRREEVYGGERDLRATDVTEVVGVRVTTPLRTACDLACLWGRYSALATLDAFMREYGLTTADFLRILPRYRGRRGVVQLRELVLLADPRAESPGESFTRGIIHDEGFSAPEPQRWVEQHGREVYRVDLAWPHLKVVVEYFGDEFHGPEQEEHDEERLAWLRRRGWHVIVVRKEDLAADARDWWITELRQVIAERTAQPRGKRRYARGPERYDVRRR